MPNETLSHPGRYLPVKSANGDRLNPVEFVPMKLTLEPCPICAGQTAEIKIYPTIRPVLVCLECGAMEYHQEEPSHAEKNFNHCLPTNVNHHSSSIGTLLGGGDCQ